MGNFKSFGDVKIVPAVPAEELHKILTVRACRWLAHTVHVHAWIGA